MVLEVDLKNNLQTAIPEEAMYILKDLGTLYESAFRMNVSTKFCPEVLEIYFNFFKYIQKDCEKKNSSEFKALLKQIEKLAGEMKKCDKSITQELRKIKKRMKNLL